MIYSGLSEIFMSNSLLFLPDLCCFLCNLNSKQLNPDAFLNTLLAKLHLMKKPRGLVALLSIALFLAALIAVIFVKFYLGH